MNDLRTYLYITTFSSNIRRHSLLYELENLLGSDYKWSTSICSGSVEDDLVRYWK